MRPDPIHGSPNIGPSSVSLINYLKELRAQGVPDAEFRDRAEQFLDRKARIKHIPLRGVFELTPLCNLDCKMCYVHLSGAQFKKDDLLPIDIWKQLAHQAQKAGMLKVLLTGGECLTYPGFEELYCYLYDTGIRPSILSNGVLFDEKHINFFLQRRPNLIQITLYGSSDDAYERVTGHRVFNTIYRNIAMLREADLPVILSITPNAYMRDDMYHLLKVAKETQLHFTINRGLIPPRKNTGRVEQDLSGDDYVEIFRIRSEMEHAPLTSVDPIELPDPNRYGHKTRGLHCGGGRSSFTIQYNGDMCPCPSLYETTAKPLEVGFAEAWRQINERAENYPMPEECGDCAYYDYCQVCPAMHANAPQPGHCDPRICERTKCFFSAGLLHFPSKE